MIRIDIDSNDLARYKSAHFEGLKEYISNQCGTIDKIIKNKVKPRRKSWQERLSNESSFAKVLILKLCAKLSIKKDGEHENLKEIILCQPEDFNKLISVYRTFDSISEWIKIIFNYDWFSGSKDKYCAYTLIKNLNIPVCPYCNRHYISYVENKDKKYKPDLDHFMPRSDYPILGLSFYNLIPSCSYCNSKFKLNKEFNEDTHINPYQMGYDKNAFFEYSLNENNKLVTTLKIKNDPKDKIKNSHNVFQLEKLYDLHRDLALELKEKALEDNDEHFEAITQSIKDLGFSKEEFYQFYFGNYMNDSDFEKRPLSKFTFDLVKDLGIMQRAGFKKKK